MIRVATIYPNASFFSSTGSARGVVRSGTGSPVYGAHVVIVDSADRPVASTMSDPDGSYQVNGLEPGAYSAYAEALDGPLTPTETPSLERMNTETLSDNFTTRFSVSSSTTAWTLTKTAGDNQQGIVGQALASQLEVLVRDAGGNPVEGISVSFAAAGGGATVVPVRATTDAQGKARSQAYLGTGMTQTITASAGLATVTFTATRP